MFVETQYNGGCKNRIFKRSQCANVTFHNDKRHNCKFYNRYRNITIDLCRLIVGFDTDKIDLIYIVRATDSSGDFEWNIAEIFE